MSTQCFGDLSQTSTKYHLVLLTSILATHESYSDNPIKSLQAFNSSKVDPNGTPYKQYNHLSKSMVVSTTRDDIVKDVNGSEKMITKYTICHDKNEKLLILTVKGSDSNSQWIQDANVIMSASLNGLPGIIHNSFLSRAEQIPVSFFVNKIVNEGYRCVFTGHSLGGAVATLVALRVLFHEKIREKSEFCKNVLYIGFGIPSVGNANFVKFVDSVYKDNFHFYINNTDLSILQTLLVNQIYVQFGKLVFLFDDCNYIMSDTYERKNQAKVGNSEHHKCYQYLENILKILHKYYEKEIFVSASSIIETFHEVALPISSIQKNQPGSSNFWNTYSIWYGSPKKMFARSRIVIVICCNNAEFIYKATLQLQGWAETFIDIKSETSVLNENMIQFEFEVAKNLFTDANAKLTLQTPFQETFLPVVILQTDFNQIAQ